MIASQSAGASARDRLPGRLPRHDARKKENNNANDIALVDLKRRGLPRFHLRIHGADPLGYRRL